MGNKTTPRALNGAVSDSEREGTRERSKTTQGEIKAVAGARRAIQKRKARENKSQETNARALLYPLFAPPVLLITRAWQFLLRLRRSQRWSCARRTAHLPPPSAKSGSSEPGPVPAPLWGSGGLSERLLAAVVFSRSAMSSFLPSILSVMTKLNWSPFHSMRASCACAMVWYSTLKIGDGFEDRRDVRCAERPVQVEFAISGRATNSSHHVKRGLSHSEIERPRLAARHGAQSALQAIVRGGAGSPRRAQHAAGRREQLPVRST